MYGRRGTLSPPHIYTMTICLEEEDDLHEHVDGCLGYYVHHTQEDEVYDVR